MKKLRKFLVSSVMGLTVLAMCGLVAPSANAAASAGDLIKMSGNTSVYYLSADGKRYVFPNEATYFSWYSDFSGVITITAAELQSYAIGGNVTMRPGTKLVKITTDPAVYAVEPNGTLRKIQSEPQAAALYGTDWAKRVVDVPDAFFTNYTVSAALASGATPAGSLVKNATGADIFYYDGTNYRKIDSEAAMTANRFKMSDVITAASTVTAGGTMITAAETALVNVSQGASAPGAVITGSGLMVSVSSSTAAGNTVPTNSQAEFLTINLTAANDGAVNISAITLTAYELGDATNIDDITIFDNGAKVGNSKNINSDREANFIFSTPITVNAGTTKTLVVKATAADAGDYALGIAKASDITASSASITGSFPVRGNKMTAVVSTNVGTLQLSSIETSTPTASFGDDDVLLASFNLKAVNEAALVSSMKLRNGGTNIAGIVDNLKLVIDGEEVATGVYSDSYVTFVINNYKIEKNYTVTAEIRGDIGTTNTSDTIKLYFKDRADIVATGVTFGYTNQLDTTSWDLLNAATEGIRVTLATSDFSIDVDKAATPAKDVKAGDTGVVLATLTFKSNGENATIEGISASDNFVITGTGLAEDEVKNVVLYDVATGASYDLDALWVDAATDYYRLTLSDEIGLIKGVAKTFLVKADLNDVSGSEIDLDDTLQVILKAAGMTITGDVSNSSITTVTPTQVSGSIMTVKEASLAWNVTNMNSATVVTGATDVSVYAAKLKAGAADGVKLSSLKLSTLATDATPAFVNNNITKLDLYLNGVLLKTVSNGITAPTGSAVGTVTFNSLATNSIAAGQEVDLVVKATFSSSFTGDTAFSLGVAAEADIVSKSVTGNKAVDITGGITGGARSITVATAGDLKVELLTTNINASQDQYVLAGATTASKYVGELKFTTQNEPVKVKKLTLTSLGTDDSSDISVVRLVDVDGNVVASKTVESTGNVIFDPLDITFAADKSTSLFISPLARGINVDGDPTSTAIQAHTIQYNLSAAAITATGVNSGSDIAMAAANVPGFGEWDNDATTKTFVITGVKLNSVTNAKSNGSLSSGKQEIAKYTLTFEHGNNRDSSNDAYKAVLENFALTINHSGLDGTYYGDLTLRVDGTTTEVADSATAGTWTSTELDNLLDGGKVNDVVTLIVTASNIQIDSAASNYSIQTVISDLNGTGDNDSIQHNSLTNMYLPYTSVTGASLSN